jgi:hypothetical protein
MRCAFLSARDSGWKTLVAAAILTGAAYATTAGVALAAAPTMASVAGVYDGGQMEVAAGLELKADGTFHYELSYGALDEQASGRWSLSGDQVVLTSAPVNPPRFSVVSQEKGTDGVLRITMDFKDPYQQQDFSALILKSGGEGDEEQLGIDGLTWSFPPSAPPVGVRLLVSVYQIVGDELKLDPDKGYTIKYHFDANDLGKVAFQATPVKIVNGQLLLVRYDRTLKFKRVKH